ncbi:MAG: hypothetical protein HZB43_04310 [candidate division Zixibacteria bacterium]|nr:hypothetical protein [candidate division Zixibacteria bacterium]
MRSASAMQKRKPSLVIIGVLLALVTAVPPAAFAQVDTPCPGCEGQFRAGYECAKATDGDWMTSAVPDAYCDSVSVCQEHPIPSGTTSANWVFKVLRNTSCIEVRAFYWNYGTSSWEQFYEVPQDNDYKTYTVPLPSGALAVSPLRTKVRVKNGGFSCGGCPLQSGEYFEGVVEWNPSLCPGCEGQFRAGYECAKATDGDWMTSAVPDAYGDSIKVIQCHSIPVGACAANWRFKVLRNWENIEVRADYWDYATGDWALLHNAPLSLDSTTYTVPIPANGLLSSPVKTRMHVKNASSPLVSGEYYEGAMDWSPCCPGCIGQFRVGHECSKANDGDWMTSAVPDLYGDSVTVIECRDIPIGTTEANWRYKVLRNNPCIEIRAYFWNYADGNWVPFHDVPEDPAYLTYTVPLPPGALLTSPLMSKVLVKNANFPCLLQSGEYFESTLCDCPQVTLMAMVCSMCST